MKIIALYLPQYHVIEENNNWWGENFTEWTNMKKAYSLQKDHYQPRIPLNDNYYDLLDPETIRWQINLAKEYGIYGFCVYHYWFDGKLLLEKPMEMFLNDTSLNIPFFFCWANDEWTNIWKGENQEIKTLIMNHYNDKNLWKDHFYYLLKFFKDDRYMKEGNKPIFVIYNPIKIGSKNLRRMIALWDKLAKENGFDGIIFSYQSPASFMTLNDKERRLFDYGFEYVPPLVAWKKKTKIELIKARLKSSGGQIIRMVNKSLLDKKTPITNNHCAIRTVRKYDDEWNDVLNFVPYDDKTIPGAFVDWDNTPRYSRNGKVLIGASPQKFQQFLVKQIERAKTIYKKDAIILFAWNEWSEGGYLEPDTKFRYEYLEAVKSALLETKELPKEKYVNIFKVE